MKKLALIAALTMSFAAAAHAQTVPTVVPLVTCPPGFTYYPNALPPSCVPPTVTVDPNAAAEAAAANAAAMQAEMYQQQLLQQQAFQRQMELQRLFHMAHPGGPGH